MVDLLVSIALAFLHGPLQMQNRVQYTHPIDKDDIKTV